MAERTLRRVATAPVAGHQFLTPPPEAHIPNHSRADKALALHSREMDHMLSDLRKRQRSAPNLSTTADHQSSTESEETLTPNSSDDREESQAFPTPAPASASWRRLVVRLLLRPPFQATTEDKPENEDSEEYGRVKHKKLEDHVNGIPRLAALLNSNDSFCIFRKFGDEAARILLIKEIELCQLATTLHELNQADAKNESLKYRLTSIEHDASWDSAQQELLGKIEVKLAAYYDFLLKYTDVRAFAEVPTRYHQSVRNWVYDNGPLEKGEETFLFNRDDFIMAIRNPQANKQSSLIEDAVETYLTNHPDSIFNGLMRSQVEREKVEDTKVVYFSTFRFGIISKISAAFLAVGFILAPVLILFLANLGRVRMAEVVGAFVLVFLVGVSLVVDLTTHEIFIIVFAYSAVLVTMLSNFLQSNAAGGNP